MHIEKTIIIRYSEIAVKTNRIRSKFEAKLIKNIINAFKKNNIDVKKLKIIKIPGRVFIKILSNEINTRELVNILQRIFGIKSISPAYEFKFFNLDELANVCEILLKDVVKDKIFAVRCRRVGKHEFTSKDVERVIGEKLRNYAKGVNLENPEIEIYLEIRNSKAYVYTEIIQGPGGLPLGTQGKGIALISGGFDSPVAAWFVMKRGVTIDVLYCNFAGYLDLIPTLKVIYTLLSNWSYGYEPKIYIVNGEKIVQEIRSKINVEYWNLIFKKILFKIAEILAKKIGAKCIVTGEVIGQVSSQTLDNIYSTSFGIEIPIIRPLAGFDKDEIIKIAKKIGTYEYSKNVEEFCAIFSSKPKTKSNPDEVNKEFSKIEYIINDLINNMKIYTLNEIEHIIKSFELHDEEIEIEKIPENAILLDLRDEKSFNQWHLPGAINVKIEDIDKVIEQFGKNKTYVLYCKTSLLSRYLASYLRSKGVKAFSLKLKL